MKIIIGGIFLVGAIAGGTIAFLVIEGIRYYSTHIAGR